MTAATPMLEAGGFALLKSKVDQDATESIVARSYQHPALGDRPVIRLASDRLGQAEDLAMEFLGFETPTVSKPIALQQRRSLGFAAWALINDPENAHFALDLVKQMKAADRKAISKPGHAWDTFMSLGEELGRSAPHFLPPFWEEVGRTYKDLGNATYAGRALNKSLVAERVHALPSDRARRRDVILEFVLAGCLAGKALSDYGNDLQSQYPADEAFTIFRDLCTRRTLGGMAPWAAMPKDFLKLAKAAGVDADAELEKWLEEVIEAPAMGRASNQFWKGCTKHCQRIVKRNPAFAVALLRHARPAESYYSDSTIEPFLLLLKSWGVFEFLWEDQHNGAPPLGEPVAEWFGRIVRELTPVPVHVLEILENLVPRLRQEARPLALSVKARYSVNPIDIDVLETCLSQQVLVDDPLQDTTIDFNGWLFQTPDHPLRNQDIVHASQDERFRDLVRRGVGQALTCRGGSHSRGWRSPEIPQRPFPLAAADRPGIKQLWHEHATSLIDQLEHCGLVSFGIALDQLSQTLWPDTLRLFPDLAARIESIVPAQALQFTLQSGLIDEYSLPALEEAVEKHQLKIEYSRYGESNFHPTFPHCVVTDKVYAYVVQANGETVRHELHLPKGTTVTSAVVIEDDLAVKYRDSYYNTHFHWVSKPKESHPADYDFGGDEEVMATRLPDGSWFLGKHAIRPGGGQAPKAAPYFHDGQRFWRCNSEYDPEDGRFRMSVEEVDPQTGKKIRESVPPWFEEAAGGTIEFEASDLAIAPEYLNQSPLGQRDGMIGWKVITRRDGSYIGEGIDGRRWDKPLRDAEGNVHLPLGLIQQPGTDSLLPISTPGGGRQGVFNLWDPAGKTMIASLSTFEGEYAKGQVTLLPIRFWHFFQVRHEPSSKKLRKISLADCQKLIDTAAEDRKKQGTQTGGKKKKAKAPPVQPGELPAVIEKLLPKVPSRMNEGIAWIVAEGEKLVDRFETLRQKMATEAQDVSSGSSRVADQIYDLAAKNWDLPLNYCYGREFHLSEHLRAAAAFLKGDRPPGELPGTDKRWFAILDDLPLRAWQSLWRAAESEREKSNQGQTHWIEFLELWHELGIPQLPGKFAVLVGNVPGASNSAYSSTDHEDGESFALVQGEDRFIAIHCDSYNMAPYYFLRYSTAKKPGNPPGYEIQDTFEFDKPYDPEEVTQFIAAVKDRDTLPVPTAEEVQSVAGRLGITPATVGLIWMGGLNLDSHHNNFLSTELRKLFGWKSTEAAAARQQLRNLSESVRLHLFQSVVSQGMNAPLAEDRQPVLDAIAQTWESKVPRRLPLSADLQKRLSSIFTRHRYHTTDDSQLLEVAAGADKHPLLKPREYVIRYDKESHYHCFEIGGKTEDEPAVTETFLQTVLGLVGVVYAETPAGDPVRKPIPALIGQINKVLDQPKMMLPLRSVDIWGADGKKELTTSQWIARYVGQGKVDRKSKVSLFDDGLITAASLEGSTSGLIGFRPGHIKSEQDLQRLKALLEIPIKEDYGSHAWNLVLLSTFRGPGMQKLAKSLKADDLPEGSWLQNPLLTAPDVVRQIQKKLKLEEDPAILYAQLLALPEPTTANLRKWNDWTAARIKKAAAPLIKQGLVLEAKRARAGRTLFLPGEWSERKAPWLPIETWKIPHLVELEGDSSAVEPCLGPMVLRPMEDLFAAAWKRVEDGDAPGYQEIKRKRKK